MLLAFDDTDSPTGGCTTRLVLDVLAGIDAVPTGMPRLVRLNPNVPWKTRGNGAVVIPLGTPEGPATRIGEWRGSEAMAFPDGGRMVPTEEMLDKVWKIIISHAQEGSDPGLALLPSPPSALHYAAAVQDVVEVSETKQILDAEGALYRGGRGLVGALAAAAWPGPATSYEFLAYRRPDAIGTPRDLDPKLFRLLDSQGTFHTWDGAHGKAACIPNTPCPVLCGLRGLDPERLRDVSVHTLLRGAEQVDAWLLFATNQASGDHVVHVDQFDEALPHQTLHARATVANAPRDYQGGHVHVDVTDDLGHTRTAIAFEPTKDFRAVVRQLLPGDTVEVVGANREAIHLEKLRVVSLREARDRVNPQCPQCKRTMKSKGTGAGFRCPDGHGSAPEEAVKFVPKTRSLREGWYEVPVMARRHLHRPIAWDAAEELRT